MIQSILGGIQQLANFFFLIAVLGTAGFSWWLSTKYRERHAEFPWKKAGIILAIEVLIWMGFNIAWGWMIANWWLVAIVVVVVLVIITRKKKDKYVV